MITTLAALAIFAPIALAQEPAGFTFAGRQVPIRFPGPVSMEAPAGYLDWEGWQYGKGLSLPTNGFSNAGDWRPFAQKTPKDDALPWRMKVVVFTMTDILDRYENGLIRQRRGYIEEEDLNEVLQAIARYRAVLAERTDGQLRFEPDVSLESDFLRDEVVPGKQEPFALDQVHEWVRSHVNGGFYQAEDGIYRGPYHGVLAIVPGPFPVRRHQGIVNDTPVETRYLSDHMVRAGDVEAMLDDAFVRGGQHRLATTGYQVEEGAPLPADSLRSFALVEPTPEEAAARTGQKASFSIPDGATKVAPVEGWRSQATEVSISQDPDRGNVLRYRERSVQRSGGFFLPTPAGGFQGGTLTFFVRSKNTSPLSVFADGENGKTVRYSLGRDLLPPPNVTTESILPTAFTNDGTWQKISIDLRSVGQVHRIGIGPTPNSLQAERLELERVVYEFDDFALTDEPAPMWDGPIDPDLEAAMKAVGAMKAGVPNPAIPTMLLSDSNLVVLNALQAYTVVKDPAVLPSVLPQPPKDPKAPLPAAIPDIRKAVLSLSPRRQEYAVRAAANQDSNLAWDFIRRQIVVGPSDIAKGTAIEVFAKKAPTSFQNDVLALVSTGSFAKLKAVDALVSAPSSSSSVGLSLLMKHNDPLVTLAVTEKFRPNDELLMRQTMWSAVNEPWDAIRLASLIKLVQAKDASMQAEGYKGVRDDSIWVRRSFVEWLGENAAEAHGSALRLAVADSAYQVRAAAARALAKQAGEVKAEDVQPLRQDPYPQVRAAYEELAKAKGLPI